MTALSHNPRYAAYAAAHGRTPEDQLDADRLEWPGGIMCGFVLWNSARLQEARAAMPEAFCFDALIDHAAYDSWLADRAAAIAAGGD